MKKDTRFTVLFLSQCILGILLGVLVFQNFRGEKVSGADGAQVFKDRKATQWFGESSYGEYEKY